MRNLIKAAGTAAALCAIPLAAQAQDAAGSTGVEASVQTPAGLVLNAQQQAEFEGWKPELKTYYATLDGPRQEAFWMLNAEQRLQLYGLPDGQKTEAWTSILAQVAAAKNGQPNPAASPATPAQPATPANPATGTPAQPATPAVPSEHADHGPTLTAE